MKTLLALFLLALGSAFAAETPDALVDRLIKTPGEFDQMCDSPPPLDPKLPMPVYKMVADRDVHLSDANLAELRARRAEVVPVLVKRLTAYDFTNQPKPLGTERKFKLDEVEVSGIHPRQLSGLLYEMVIGLDAVEALPQLLRLEEQIRSLLAKADADPKSAVPTVTLDGYITFPRGDQALSKRDQAMTRGRVVQRELLSVIMQLLRAQKFAPLLESDFEKAYGAELKKTIAEDEDLKDIKTPADAKAKNMEWVKFDPIYNIPTTYLRNPPQIPFSSEVRNTIRGYAEQFTKTVPKEEWKTTWAK